MSLSVVSSDPVRPTADPSAGSIASQPGLLVRYRRDPLINRSFALHIRAWSDMAAKAIEWLRLHKRLPRAVKASKPAERSTEEDDEFNAAKALGKLRVRARKNDLPQNIRDELDQVSRPPLGVWEVACGQGL